MHCTAIAPAHHTVYRDPIDALKDAQTAAVSVVHTQACSEECLGSKELKHLSSIKSQDYHTGVLQNVFCSLHQDLCLCLPLTSSSLSFVAQWSCAGSGLHWLPGSVSQALS